jgi:lipid A oxidase
MGKTFRFVRHASVLLLLGMSTFPEASYPGEFVASFYGGKAWTRDTDVRLHQSGATDLTFQNVSWDDESFKGPYYWGVRLTYWPDKATGWGAALDFTHAKMLANLNQNVRVSGTRGGVPVNAHEPLSDTFDGLSFTHGYNLLTGNALYRWSTGRTHWFGESRPYAGVGLGIAYPHVEVAINGQSTVDYQITGPAYQGFVGLDIEAFERVSVVVEYKLTYAAIDADISGGGSVRFKPWTQHAVLGAAYHF